MFNREIISAEEAKNHAFDAVLHRNFAKAEGGIRAMMNKDNNAHKAAVNDYFSNFDKAQAADESEAEREKRTENYANLTRQYYNLASDLYEYGWGQSFHFCRFAYGESFARAIARHEHYLAHNIGLKRGMRVLDVGCGIGAPAREIVKFTGAHVTGITINEYQVTRAREYARKEGLEDYLDFVQGDFMTLPFEDNSFDAVYAIEATVHAPSLEGVYSEIFRVLKPGGTFGVYEWLMTENYNNDDVAQRQIRLDIEQGDGIAQMFPVSHGLQAINNAGFDLQYHEDLAASDEGPAPWYWPIGSDLRYAQTLGDYLTVLRMNSWGRMVAHNMFSVLEAVRLLPAGTRQTAESLAKAADALVLGGQKKLFTPMYLMVAKKPVL